MMTTALLSTTYFGPVQWYQKLCRANRVLMEQCESFQKQTFRNRCVIATANGTQALTVPVMSPHDTRQAPVRDIRISDHGNWRHLHWQAIATAYGDSPFFDYYQDDLRPFFEHRWTFLFDFNEAIRETMCELLDIHPMVDYTESYLPAAPTDDTLTDYRATICPKHPAPDPDFAVRPYYQVYAARHGFLPNLSVIDLLLNMGPEAVFWL